MNSWKPALVTISLMVILGSILLLPSASGEIKKETALVDIDHYEETAIAFDTGDSVRITVDVRGTTEYPISVFLLKGEEARSAWIESEEVDLEAIKAGEGVPDQNTTFQVVSPFSRRNVTSFNDSITLGEHDDYYVIIALYRGSQMSTEEVLERATLVNYEVVWEINEKEVPWYLLFLAVAFFVIGAVLLMIYFWRRGEEEPEDDRPSPIQGGAPGGGIRRAPPRRGEGYREDRGEDRIRRAPPRRGEGYREDMGEDRTRRAPPRPGHVEDRSNDGIRRAPPKPGYVRDRSNDNIRRAPPRYL